MPPTIFISAGEASGEHYGALLIAALRQKLEAEGRQAAYFGMGGERMVAAGLERVVRAEDVAVMGITEIVRHLPRIYREYRNLKRAIRERRPDVAILIDFPDIHFKLAEEFHRQGVPVIFFVSPQLWAWKKHRIKLVQKYVTRMLVIFPFEEPFYRERGVDAEFVGHPLAELPLPTVTREQFALADDLDPAATWIGLLPGSRPKEIRANLPEMLAAARLLMEAHEGQRTDERYGRQHEASALQPVHPQVENSTGFGPRGSARFQFVLPLAPTLTPHHLAEVSAILNLHATGLPVTLVPDARAALFHARASVVASGTATVEAALIGNPFVVVYRVSPLTYWIAKRVVIVPHIAMANLIAGKRVVPELIQEDFTAAKIVEHLAPLLPDGPARQSMMKELQSVGASLGTRQSSAGQPGGAIDRVAAVALELLQASSPVLETSDTHS